MQLLHQASSIRLNITTIIILLSSHVVECIFKFPYNFLFLYSPEEGVPNPYETPSHYLSTHNGGPNGVEKNFDNPLYTEGSVSPPLPPRIEHPYATLEGAQERYESISVSPTDEKTSQKKENPYLDPVNPMNSSTVVYAHIQ